MAVFECRDVCAAGAYAPSVDGSASRPRRSRSTILIASMLTMLITVAKQARAEEPLPLPDVQTKFHRGISPEPVSDWKVVLGGGIAAVPKYEGSDEFEPAPLPLISITWRDLIFLDPRGLGLNAFRTERFQFGGAVGYAPGRDQDDADILRGLGDIDPAARAQLFANYSLGLVQLKASVSRDIGGSDGLQVEFGAQTFYPISRNLRLTAGASATWADDNYMETFFGVSPGQSASSGLPVYDAGAGFKRVDLSVGVLWNVDESWFVRGDAKVGYLLGDAADSPVTQERLQPTLALGVGYKF